MILSRCCSLTLLFAGLAAQHPVPAPTPASAPAATEKPRLVVLCSVDQLASWVFAAGRPHFAKDGGFARLFAEGTEFTDCAYLHACTETGPGHATIGTGAPARAHGIIKNEWFDREKAGVVYCASDAGAEPLAAFPEGKERGAARLLVPTIGDLLKQTSPSSKVVAIAHKDRAAILMGGRHADAVAWFENVTGRFVTNARWGKEPPAWLTGLAATKPADSFFGWNWDLFAPAAAYADCEDIRLFEIAHASSGKRTLPVEVRGGRHDEPTPAYYVEAFLSPIANEVVLAGAIAALAGSELGRDDVPDLFCVSFPSTDTVGHYFGPDSVEARDTLLRFDRVLAQLLLALDEHVGAGRYAFVLTADHGVGLPPEVAKQRGLGGGRALLHTRARQAAEQALRQHFGIESKEGEPPAGPFVQDAREFTLVLDRAKILAQRPGEDQEKVFAAACAVVATAVGKVPGIASGHVVAELLRDGPVDDPIRRALWYGACEGRSGDVAFVVQPYWLEAGLPASHGTPYDYDRQVPLLASGPGLKGGERSVAAVSPGLGAVLAAHWFGFDPPSASVDKVPDGVFVR